jgi:hypothetical protein
MTRLDDARDAISCSSCQFLPSGRVIGLGGLRPALQRRDSTRTERLIACRNPALAAERARKRHGFTAFRRAPAGGVRRAILVLDVMPSAGQLATEVHLAGWPE